MLICTDRRLAEEEYIRITAHILYEYRVQRAECLIPTYRLPRYL